VPWVDDLLDTLTHPAVLPNLINLARRPEPPDYAQLRERIARIEARMAARRGRPPKGQAVTPAAVAPASPPMTYPAAAPAGAPSPPAEETDWVRLRDTIIDISASLNEAERFARDDGMAHPETVHRLDRVYALAKQLPEAERFDLAPDRLAQWSPERRAQAQAVLPLIRSLRQQTLNTLTTPEAVAQAAATARQLGSALQGVTVAQDVAPAAIPGTYSRYAPEMDVSVGCVPCGRAHLAAVQTTLEKAAEAATTAPLTDPAVRNRLAFAQEELAALLGYDWTPEKVAANPPAERAALEPLVARAQALRQQIGQATTPEAVRAAAEAAAALTADLERAFPPPHRQAAQVPQVPAPSPGAWRTLRFTPPRPDVAAVDPTKVWGSTLPAPQVVGAVTVPTDSAAAFDRLAAALQQAGIRVTVRNTASENGWVTEGQYVAPKNIIQLGPAALAKDWYAVQILTHEAAHALLHNLHCLPVQPPDTPEAHAPFEAQAEDVTLAALVSAGLPVEDRNGDILPPGTRQVNWDVAREHMDPTTFADVKWATDWIVSALEGATPPPPVCPVPQTGVPGGGN